ncbi:hypothetical protein [Halosolutus gelatinilyticus]|uniref:hypothetical protein n=1 Tax=Halosolutus gelatinilyticus TaxID=2931975 RepID=UPI001FF1F53B|nr:hypothetical protein [Halosolutus gelatinilyticus]
MALSGPRLDRPSAIGDEGRPRAASLWIATLVVVGLTVLAGVRRVGVADLTTLATVVGMTVAGIGLLERDDRGFVELFVGHGFVMTFGSVTALLLVAAPLIEREWLAVTGFALALLGIGFAWADVGTEGLKRSAEGTALAYASLLAATVVGLLLIGIGVVVRRGLLGLVAGTSPLLSIGGLLLVAAGAAWTVLLSFRWLPVRQLTRRDRRPAMERRLATLRRVLRGTIFGALGLLAALTVLALGGWLSAIPLREPAVRSALAALSSWVVLGPIVGVAVASLLAGCTAFGLRALTRQFGAAATRHSAAVAVGVALVVLVPPALLTLLFALPPAVGPFAVLVLAVGPIVFVVVAAVGVLAAWLGLLPDRAAGPAIAAAGLVIAAIGFARGDPVLVFACVAGAALVWDVSSFGLGVTGELGHIPDTRRLELFHGVLATGVAAVAVLVAIGLNLIRTGVFADVGGTGAVVAVAIGTLLLLLPLRG